MIATVRALLVFLALLLVSASAAALTPQEKAGARASAQRGVQAFNEGDFEKALDYLRRAEELVHAPTHQLYMARAQRELGRWVAARELYLSMQREQLAADAPHAFKEARKKAEEELAELDPRIPLVTVVVEGAEDQPVEVFQNGELLPSALVGIPQPMDPGDSVFQATAPGMRSDELRLTIEEGTEQTVLLSLKASPEGRGGTSSAATPTEVAPRGWSGLRIAGVTSLGVAVAGAAVGTVLLLNSNTRSKDADDLFDTCNPGCSETEQNVILNLDDEAKSFQTIALIGYGVGGAALVTGVTLLILDGKKSKKEQAASEATRVRPYFAGTSLGLIGRF